MFKKRLIKDITANVAPETPIVLYIRGSSEQPSQNMYRQCLDYVKGLWMREQRIQLHCFNGTTEDAREWLLSFPNTYFSISGIVIRAHDPQKEAIKSIPLNRLLLESDAPYLCPQGNTARNHPSYTTITAQAVASLRSESLDNLLRANLNNVSRLFDHMIGPNDLTAPNSISAQ